MAHMSGIKDRRILAQLVTDNRVEDALKLGSAHAEPIEALERLLFYLGFGAQLDWARLGADGHYEEHTRAAVAAFAVREGVPGDGAQTPSALLTRMLERYDAAVAQDLATLSALRATGAPETTLRVKSQDQANVRALQRLLYVVGYGDEMKWEKFGDDGDYGANTTRAVVAFSTAEEVPSDGMSVGAALADKLIAALANTRERPEPLVTDALKVTASTIFVGGPGGDRKIAAQVKFGASRGWKTLGDLPLATVLSSQPDVFSGLPASILHVLSAVVENEGSFDAVNAYDNAFLSFGIFQWTAGTEGDKGELAAFLDALGTKNAPVVQKYFGAFGLGVTGLTSGKNSPATGHLTLHGQALTSADRKAPLRTAEWVYHFWKAGHDPVVQQAEVDYALARVQIFYRNPSKRIGGRLVADYVSSEVGVALLLDEHVNRPGHVPGTLAHAVADLAASLGDPTGWDDAAEGRLLDRYLAVRQQTNMTHAAKRGERIRALAGRVLSAQRGSFAV